MSAHPVIPGFYSDPSICRVGDEYYLVTSSFEYFPGVPVFRSVDLVHWTQVGNALPRAEAFNLSPGLAGASRGIFAATIRHRDGLFWVVTTCREDVLRGQVLVCAPAPEGPWSEPLFIDGAVGIDPDLAWDEDGQCYLTWTQSAICQAKVSLQTGRLLSVPVAIWSGTGLAHTEGPHLYRVDGWWYLLVAEGGTHTGHAVSVSRSRSISGPFEPSPGNPLLSHRSLDHPVQATGHADLVELSGGGWAMVHLGIRQRGGSPGFHVNGRETFLAGVDWVDGWPTVDEDRYKVGPVDTSFVDAFDADRLDDRWVSPGRTPHGFVTQVPGEGAHLTEWRAADATASLALICVRARDAGWTATAALADGRLALVVRMDDDHWFAVERIGDAVRVRMKNGPVHQVLASTTDAAAGAELVLKARPYQPRLGIRPGGPDSLSAGFDDGTYHELFEIDGRYLSTEVATGYTGRMIGVEALDGPATVRSFSYTRTDD
ncbi:glycoside hydrolase family 43 protein [Pseudofrankia inefficax]|uniref:Xylan 1,4-beta-xylosidase n=1 Tax=Pseudofrankia inefficax (strain DSM 45817 / CECT 9037 / DDB 130130 / EuI1c) TaxID=298654 RepID=E3IUE5_PSEI1|nr:glycoside hydrolase family 43 protein [Pseudofrankia inefficax]ADP83630.1 Xylan 1,4-beta-xylosidase [Pseudofrankia inefficax]